MTLIDCREGKREERGGSVLSEGAMGAAKGSRRRILNEEENKSDQHTHTHTQNNFENLSDF